MLPPSGFGGRKQAFNIRAVSAASRSFPNAAPSLAEGRDQGEEGCRPRRAIEGDKKFRRPKVWKSCQFLVFPFCQTPFHQ